MTFQVTCVRQNQVGKGDRFRLEGVCNDQEGNFVLAILVLVIEHLAHLGGVHARVPRHVGHEDQQGIDLVGIATPGIGDDVVHQAMHRQWVFPGKGLVDAHRAAIVIDEQVIRIFGPAERHAVQRGIWLHGAWIIRRLGARRNRPRERRLVAETAGPVNGAENAHQNGHGANGLKPIGMRRQATHGVEGHRVTGDCLVLVTPGIGPGNG